LSETTLVKITDDVLCEIHHGLVVFLVSLDIVLSTTSDTICHKTIKQRLESKFSINGIALQCFQFYLSGRTYSVHVGSSSSLPVPVSAGVPEVSVLRPLLFTVYVSPISWLIDHCHTGCHVYAEDTQLFNNAMRASVHDDINWLVQCVKALQIWFLHSGQLLNTDESEVIFFGTREQLHLTDFPTLISIAGYIIPVSQVLKILDMKLDSMLLFNDRLSDVVHTCSFQMCALGHIHRYMSLDVTRSVAFSIVSSQIDYCNGLVHCMSSGAVLY
jgi:Reverse transcriptase (RNA-dependent DNA polymerase)